MSSLKDLEEAYKKGEVDDSFESKRLWLEKQNKENNIIDVYEGKDPERNKSFQLENQIRAVHGDNWTTKEVVKGIQESKKQQELDDIESLQTIYEKIKEVLKKYMDMNEYGYHIVTLWIIGTYCYEKFSAFPLLFINAVRGSGKTRLLKLIESMAWNGKIQANLSESVVFRSKKKHTMLIDEFEQVGSKETNTLRELINSSYKRGARVERMKEVLKEGKKDYEVEGFDLYSPLAMANIWGMDDTVKDRCLVIHLDKSSNQTISKLLEDFENEEDIKSIKKLLLRHNKNLYQNVDNDDVDRKKGLIATWNNYICSKPVNNNSTLYTLSTSSTLSTLFKKIDETGIYGRDLELFFPLFMISTIFGEQLLDLTLEFSKQKFNEKNSDEYTENPDIILLDFLWKNYNTNALEYIYLSDLKGQFQLIANLKELDNRTLSKSLERLNIVLDKKRDYKGVKVMIDLAKVNEKLKRYDPKNKEVLDGKSS